MYSEKFLKQITSVGMLNYPISKILNIFDEELEDVQQFTLDFYNKNSEIYKAYMKGKDKSDYLIDTKLFELAKEGDLSALTKFEKRKKEQLSKREDENFHNNFMK